MDLSEWLTGKRPRVNVAFQEHLGTGIYKGPVDKVIDIARRRLGNEGIFTITSTGDDRLSTDGRFEHFVDGFGRSSRKYELNEIGDRGVAILDKGGNRVATLYNSIEYETGEGHLLAFGMPRDLTSIRTGSGISIEGQLDEIVPHNPIVLLGSPTFAFGGCSERVIRRELRGTSELILGRVDGIAIYSGISNLIPGTNRKALSLARELVEAYNHIAPYLENDGHSLREFGRVSTSIPNPEYLEESDRFDGTKNIESLRASLKEVAKEGIEETLRRNKPSLTDKAVGLVETFRHSIDLKSIHPRRLKREQRK